MKAAFLIGAARIEFLFIVDFNEFSGVCENPLVIILRFFFGRFGVSFRIALRVPFFKLVVDIKVYLINYVIRAVDNVQAVLHDPNRQ